MFEPQTYTDRRNALKARFDSGIILFLGNQESAANYTANTYSFRQDSSFLYYFGLDLPGLAAIIDVDNNIDTIYGNDFTVDDIVWMGPQPTMAQRAEIAGAVKAEQADKLPEVLKDAFTSGKKIHLLPQYRPENLLKISSLLGIYPDRVNDYVSEKLIRSVIEQRSVKSEEEIKEIDFAVDIANKMHTTAMRMLKPGISEKKIAGMIEGIALSLGNGLSFRPIVSIHGETLHNHSHENIVKEGDLLVNDSGAETKLHYASDITRTLPVSGKFTQKQKEIYEIVLKAEMLAIEEIKPDVFYKDLHMLAARIIVDGLKEIGFMHGDTDEALNAGAHALFFSHGLGHMMGLDVHDLEGLGENFVGYDEETTRSPQFGLSNLRLAKRLKPGYVFTVEPGIYFIPELIDMWQKQSRHTEFINYDKVEEYRDFGGIRIEDNVLVTDDGYRVLGSKPIPKYVQEGEALASN
ncbi:MAG: aminopeptidase P family protein [Ignavibacteriae bacterium]|nr:MAG: aminopeptidase P family protein [Ignavibacteriota bacterium]